MNDEPRQKLRELVIEHGRSLANDPRRCEALLKDYCGSHKREISVLVGALKNRVVDDLLKSSASVPQEIVLGRLRKRLEDDLAMTAEAALWAVESWALALRFITVSPVVTHATQLKAPTGALSGAPVASPSHRPEILLADRYLDNDDGTVTDVATGLQWMRFSLGQEWKGGTCIGEAGRFTLKAAFDKVKTLNLQGGYSDYRDWRLPAKEELLSLVYCSSGRPKTWNDTGKLCEGEFDRPTIEQQAFPNTPSMPYFWCGSPDADFSINVGWEVSFHTGLARYGSTVVTRYTGFNAIRLVRGKQ